MRRLSARYDEAVTAIDAANAADPTIVDVRGRPAPLALVQGQLAAEWVPRLADTPDEALLLAARAHHLRRWQLRRDAYPPGRAGYLRWRRDQKVRHAADVAELLTTAGYGAEQVERVQRLIRRDAIDGSQTVEDAACLVFIETQLGSFAAKTEHQLTVDVIRKTARKMSARALSLVDSIPLGSHERSLLAEALAEE